MTRSIRFLGGALQVRRPVAKGCKPLDTHGPIREVKKGGRGIILSVSNLRADTLH